MASSNPDSGRSGSTGSSGRKTPAAFEDRLPPQNLDAERGVLGAILLDNKVMDDVALLLKPEDFYRDSHQILYRTIRMLYEDGKPVDVILLSDTLRSQGIYDQVGGDEALEEILGGTPHSANAKYHANIVREKSIARQLIQVAQEILKESYSNSMTAGELLEEAERRIFHVAEDQAAGETIELGELMTEAIDRIVTRTDDHHGSTSIKSVVTGLIDFDAITNGLQPQQLIVLAARPSMGKTALALNICEHVAVHDRTPVLFVSLEMGRAEIAERLLCAHSRVDGHVIRTGKGLGNRELQQLGRSHDILRQAKLFIDDTPSRNMIQITANARRLKAREKIGLVVIDYIQLIDSESADGRESRQEQIARISRRLKMLAREVHVPVIALSQLNRAVETREDRRPRMADLRESGAIEQDADIVLLLHRPEYYDPNDQPGMAELIVAKNRNGPTDRINLTFLRKIMRFENHRSELPPTLVNGNGF
jgi:replicative DNA helicase